MDAPVGSLRMSREEYRRWAEHQPKRHELVHGEVIQMAAGRVAHARIKAQIWSIFRREVKAQGLQCEALPDGMTVEVGPDTDYEPDAMINCGPRLDDEDIATPNPVVVVEVLSPSTRRVDAGAKLADYFKVASIQHYLIVRTRPQEIIHNRRLALDQIETRVISDGVLRLDPPGLDLSVAEVFDT